MRRKRFKPRLSSTMLLFYWMMIEKGRKGTVILVHKYAVKLNILGQQYLVKCNPLDEEFYLFLEEELTHVFYSLHELDTWIDTNTIS